MDHSIRLITSYSQNKKPDSSGAKRLQHHLSGNAFKIFDMSYAPKNMPSSTELLVSDAMVRRTGQHENRRVIMQSGENEGGGGLFAGFQGNVTYIHSASNVNFNETDPGLQRTVSQGMAAIGDIQKTQKEHGKKIEEQGKTQKEQGKTQKEQGKELEEVRCEVRTIRKPPPVSGKRISPVQTTIGAYPESPLRQPGFGVAGKDKKDDATTAKKIDVSDNGVGKNFTANTAGGEGFDGGHRGFEVAEAGVAADNDAGDKAFDVPWDALTASNCSWIKKGKPMVEFKEMIAQEIKAISGTDYDSTTDLRVMRKNFKFLLVGGGEEPSFFVPNENLTFWRKHKDEFYKKE